MVNNIVKIDNNRVTASVVAFPDEGRIYLTHNGHCTFLSLPLFLQTSRHIKRGIEIDELISELLRLKEFLLEK